MTRAKTTQNRNKCSKRTVQLAQPKYKRLKYVKWRRRYERQQRRKIKRWLESIPVASPRVVALAIPKHKRKKYRRPRRKARKLLKKYKAFKASPRLLELSYRPIRILVSTKREFLYIIPKERKQKFEKFIHLSAGTIYSKLARAQEPKPKQKPAKWTDAEWEAHKKKCQRLARPKIEFLEPEKIWPARPIDMKLIFLLAKPKSKTEKFDYKDSGFGDSIAPVSPAATKYWPSDNILSLAKPKMLIEDDQFMEKCQGEEYEVPKYMRHVKSVGFKKLSEAKNPRGKYVKTEIKEEFNKISPTALKYNPTGRIKKLAEPTDDRGEKPRDNFSVPKAALKELPSAKKKYYLNLSKPFEWKCTPKFEAK